MPVPDETTAPGAVQKERDAWVQAIHKLCSDWKRKSMGEHMFVETNFLRNVSIAEDGEDSDTDLESNGGSGGGNMSFNYPPVDYENADPTSGGGDHVSAGDTSQSYPSADYTKPVPKPRSNGKTAVQVIGPDISPPSPSPTSPSVVALSSPTSPQPSPSHTALTSSSTVSESLESGSSAVKTPSRPSIPAPPPLPFKIKTNPRKPQTKAFHWDLVGPEKVKLSLVS